MNNKKTIQINPELFKVSNKKQTESRRSTRQKPASLNTLKNKLINKTKDCDASGNLQDAFKFLSNIKDKNKWIDVNLDMPDVLAPDNIMGTASLSAPSEAAASATASATATATASEITATATATPSTTANPPYGCLKKGFKPTYRNWLRSTQKNHDPENIAAVDLNAMAAADVILNEKLDKELAVIDELKTAKAEVKQKIKTKTLKKHVIGKNASRKTITVLLKDSDKKKQVTEAKQSLKSESIDKIRDFLIKHNLLKASSYAPNNILLKIFENAKLTGDVYNTNVNTLMNNILAI